MEEGVSISQGSLLNFFLQAGGQFVQWKSMSSNYCQVLSRYSGLTLFFCQHFPRVFRLALHYSSECFCCLRHGSHPKILCMPPTPRATPSPCESHPHPMDWALPFRSRPHSTGRVPTRGSCAHPRVVSPPRESCTSIADLALGFACRFLA